MRKHINSLVFLRLTCQCRDKSVEGQRIKVHGCFIAVLQLISNIVPEIFTEGNGFIIL